MHVLKHNRTTRRRKTLPWQRKRRKILILAAIPLILVASFFIWRLRLMRQVEVRLDAVRAEGVPVTAEELEAWLPAIPEEENAERIYDEAFKAFSHRWRWAMCLDLQSIDKSQIGLIEKGIDPVAREAKFLELLPDNTHSSGHACAPHDPYPADIQQAMAAFVADNEATLQFLHQAVGLKHTQTRAFSGIRTFRIYDQLLEFEAILATEAGDTERAVDALCVLMGPRHAQIVSLNIWTHNTWMSCAIRAARDAERLVNRTDPSDEELRRLSEAFASTYSEDASRLALIAERCREVSFLRNLSSGARNRQDSIMTSLAESAGLLDLILLTTLDGVEQCMAQRLAPLPALYVLRDELSQAENKSLSHRLIIQFSNMSSTVRYLERCRLHAAMLRVTQILLAIERYRLAHESQLPKSLEDLVPAYLESVPLDVDGQPIRYRVADQQYKVYTVYSNLKDDDGAVNRRERLGDWCMAVRL